MDAGAREQEVPIWYEIEDDGLPVRCSSCGKFGKMSDCVYIEQVGGRKNIIIHKSCVGEKWLNQNLCGTPPKTRGQHRIWWTRKPRLRLVKS